MRLLRASLVIISLLGTLYLTGTYTHGSLMWLLFGLSGWALMAGLVTGFLSEMFRQQKLRDQMSRNQYRLRQSRHQPYSHSLRLPPSNHSSQRTRGTLGE